MPDRTLEESIALREMLHAKGFEQFNFVRFAENDTYRIGADANGRVYVATYFAPLGWGPWDRANTHSFDRYVRRIMGR